MKKTLLSLGMAAVGFAAIAQMNANEDGYTVDMLSGSSNCYANALPSTNGHMNADQSTFTDLGSGKWLNATGLVLTSKADVGTDGTPIYFSWPYVVGVEPNTTCESINRYGNGPDLSASNASKITITASSSIAGAKLETFIGGKGLWSATSSTFNTGSGDGILTNHTFAAADVAETFTYSFDVLDAAVWAAWADKSDSQSYAFRSKTNNAVFTITKITVGTEAEQVVGLFDAASESSFEVFPNPVNGDVVSFSKDLNNVTVMNTLGSVVFEAASAKELNVSSFENGMYILKSDEGSTKLIVE